MKKGIKAMNFWRRAVAYSAPKSAQNVWNPKKRNSGTYMSAESYDSCGDYDTGCADGGDDE